MTTVIGEVGCADGNKNRLHAHWFLKNRNQRAGGFLFFWSGYVTVRISLFFILLCR